MAFFTAKTDAASVAENTGGNYITTSGIYDVVIKYVSVKVNEHNARSLDFNVEYNGTPHTYYGLTLDNNDLTPNYQQAIFNKLLIVTGTDSVSDPEVVTVELGKDKTPTDLSVLLDLCDLECKMAIQFQYEVYNGEIRERKVIKNFYSVDGKTASEIVNNVAPKQLAKDLEYAEKVKYTGCTEEEVAAWKENRKAGNKAPVTKAPAANKFAAPGKKTPSFIKQ